MHLCTLGPRLTSEKSPHTHSFQTRLLAETQVLRTPSSSVPLPLGFLGQPGFASGVEHGRSTMTSSLPTYLQGSAPRSMSRARTTSYGLRERRLGTAILAGGRENTLCG